MTDISKTPGSAADEPRRFEAPSSDADAIRAIKTASAMTPLLVDFDETLFLSNSTEEYLSCARPRVVGLAMLALLSAIKPWTLMPVRLREHSRDWFRVVTVTVFLPWTILVWRHRSRELAVTQTNEDLRDALAASPSESVVITTLGFRFVVATLSARMQLRSYDLCASRFWRGFADRAAGKRNQIERRYGRGVVKQSIVVTDSEADRDLLDHAAAGYLVRWPGAHYDRALAGTYMPFYYLDRVKHPGQRFFVKTVISDDWLLAVLAVVWSLPNLPALAAAMLLASLSFWTIYELGYMENDRVAATLESEPFLHAEYDGYRARHHWATPWLWAGVLAGGGLAIAVNWSTGRPDVPVPTIALAWTVLLVTTRGVFAMFNRLDKMSRVWVYPVLQVARSFGLVILAPISLVGAMALTAQVLSRWSAYMVYRYSRLAWPGPSFTQLIRLIMFAVLVSAVGFAQDSLEIVQSWQFGVIVGWFAIRARKGIRDATRSAAHITSRG